ncbi:MAG: glycosyltransferase family 9 protein [Planctomycetota bacterium]
MGTPSTSVPMKRLQQADKFLGLLACAALQPLKLLRARRPRASSPEKVLLVKFWGIGSLQLLTPAVSTLRRDLPRARLVLLTLRQNEDFARGLRVFDEVMALDVRVSHGPRGWWKLFGRFAALVSSLRRERFDRVYDFEFFTRFSAVISLATGAGTVVGFAAPGLWRGGFHTETIHFNRYWHVSRNFRALAGGENGEEIDMLTPYPTCRKEALALDERLERAGVPAGRPIAVLNANAGSLALERRWPPASFATLARRLALEDGTPVVLVGSEEEKAYVAAIARAVGPAPRGLLVDLSGQLTIGELTALLARAAVHVTNDSGPMHVGAALGTPTVALFGPETPVMYGPVGRRSIAIWRPPPCSPCINVHDNKVLNCVRGVPECLTNIPVDLVLSEARERLADDVLVVSRDPLVAAHFAEEASA